MLYPWRFLFILCTTLPLQAQDTTYYRSPLDTHTVLSLAGNFGEPRENHFHSGVDFRVGGEPGAKLYAVADGYISRISINAGGYGKAIYINHPNGTTSVYAHLHVFAPNIKKYIENIQYEKQRFAINEYPKPSQFPVKKGQVIGIAGNSGNSFGAHLHFELRKTTSDRTFNIIKSGVYKMDDNIPPKFHRIIFYEYREISGIPEITPYLSFTDTGNIRQEPLKLPDTFFIAADVDDFQNGPSGTLGINRLVVKLDEETIFAFRMDNFLFQDTKYINSLAAYDWWITHKRPTIKTYLEPGNKLLYIYDKVANNGLITLYDNKTHLLEIIAYDDVGNASQLTFTVQKKQPLPLPKEVAADETETSYPAKGFPMFHDSTNVYHKQGLKITVPAGNLYRPVWFTADTLPHPAPDIAYSAYWRLHTPEIPLHRGAEIHLTAHVPEHLRSKAIIASYNNKGNITSSGGTWENNGVKASISSFGNYFVTIDTLPPLIKPQFNRGANLKEHDKLTLKITDDISGINSYQATIDNAWALMEYDAKNNTLEYFFDTAHITHNTTHTIIITVTDQRHNKAILKTDFIW